MLKKAIFTKDNDAVVINGILFYLIYSPSVAIFVDLQADN